MTRRSREAGFVKSFALGVALVLGLATSAQAQNKLTLSGSATITTNYEFRGVSQSSNNPAVQPEFDLTYGMWYAYIWGSNNSLSPNDVEIDYGLGITPKWHDITFNIAGLAYTYPGSDSLLDYFELKTGATWAKGAWSIGIFNYWSPDNFQTGTQTDAIEGDVGYTFSRKIWNFFTPSISGVVGTQLSEHESILPSYMYWNAGLTLGFMDHWSADIRYWDTDASATECIPLGGARDACDATVVGSIKATF
jgi:uncharacterized protein (TIGR02001 family)